MRFTNFVPNGGDHVALGEVAFSAVTETAIPAIPEHGTLAIFGLGLIGLGCVRRRRTV